jgi:hypothetical protein
MRDLPALRFDINEAREILRMSRAQLYNRIAEGAIAIQKDGARTYISLRELERYVERCEHRSQLIGKASSPCQARMPRDDRLTPEKTTLASNPASPERAHQLHR